MSRYSILGTYHYKARIYSASLGRFLQSDPIGYGDGMNMYAYVGNDPMNRRDPSGLEIEVYGGCGIGCISITGDWAIASFLDSLSFYTMPTFPGGIGGVASDEIEVTRKRSKSKSGSPPVGAMPIAMPQSGTPPKVQCDPHGSGYCWVIGVDGKISPKKTDEINKQWQDSNCKLGNFLKAPGGDVVAGTVAAGTLASALLDLAHVLNKTLGPVGYALSGAWLLGEASTLVNCK